MAGVFKNTRESAATREARIIELYQKGVDTRVIAQRVGMRTHSVHRVLSRRGLRQMSPHGVGTGPLW